MKKPYKHKPANQKNEIKLDTYINFQLLIFPKGTPLGQSNLDLQFSFNLQIPKFKFLLENKLKIT